MSFQIKDKKKIALLRKCVQILTHDKEDFFMHYTKTHIRFFNLYKDDSTYMIDFQAPWFSKFMAPDVILNGELEILQIRCNRDIFLQSFNLLDDTELEFLISFSGGADYGKLKVIKTRDLYVIEANVGFDVDKEIQCDENYNFPEDQLLINSHPKHLKNLRGIFKTKSKSEVLEMSFFEEQLVFKGDINKKFDYEIRTKVLENYGSYLENGHDHIDRFQLNLALKHILGLIKICDLVEGNFMSAMELSEAESCVTFLFTHSHSRDFKFIIGVGNVRFQKIDDGVVVGGQTNRLRKANQNMMSSAMNPMKSESQLRAQQEGVKAETKASESQVKTTQEQAAAQGISVSQVKANESQPPRVPTATTTDQPMEGTASIEKQPSAAQRDASMQEEVAAVEGEENQEANQKQKQEFYNKVDQEEFF